MEGVVVRRVPAIPEKVEEILRGLPEWFGMEQALVEYIEQARTLPTYTVQLEGQTIGACLVKHHSSLAAEICLLAVERGYHGQGCGRKLVDEVEAELAQSGVEYVQVKTLGPSHPSVEYAATRRFYETLGYVGLEEVNGIWPDNPCLVMVKRIGT